MFRKISVLIFLLSTLNLFSQDDKLWYMQPAKSWADALPLGNGSMGIMLFGGVQKERLQLNEETLWSNTPRAKRLPPDYKAQREQVMQLISQDKMKEAAELMAKLDRIPEYTGEDAIIIEGTTSVEHGYETMGNLWLFMENHDYPETEYYRDLKLATATASVKYKLGETEFERLAFTSHPAKLGVVKLSAKNAKVSFSAMLNRPMDLKETWSDLQNQRYLKNPHPVEILKISDNEFAMKGRTSNNGLEFQVNVRIIAQDGKVYFENNRLVCKDASEVVILICPTSAYYKKDMSSTIKDRLDSAQNKGFEALLKEHVQDYSKYFSRFSLKLDSTPASVMPTDMRMNRVRKGVMDPRLKYDGDYDPALTALLSNFSRYTFISTCRNGTLPASLQYWNPSLFADWYGRYTTNVNLQINYWGAETTNLSDLNDSLFDMLESFLPTARDVAKKSYGCNGTVFPGRGVSIYGLEYIYDSWNDGGAWLADHFWQHYLFTKDEKFLKERAYPFMKSMAEFYADFLREDENGFLVTGPSHSPENSFLYNSQRPTGIDYGITMTQAIVRELFTHTIAASEILDSDKDFRENLKTKTAKLFPYKIGRYGIQEWRRDYDEYCAGHRHQSHLYGLYPGTEITKDSTPQLYEAAQKSLTRRIENGGFWTAWSATWGVALAARLHNPEQAYYAVNRLLAKESFDNLFALHHRANTFEVFSMDSNLGFSGVLSEVFMQSHAGYIELLPALPSCWKNGEIKGICARGGFVLDFTWKNSKLNTLKIFSKLGGKCIVKYKDKSVSFDTAANTEYKLNSDLALIKN